MAANTDIEPPRVTRESFDAVLFDLDGVVTDTADIHSAAWERVFDDYLEKRAKDRNEAFVPFDEDDYLSAVHEVPIITKERLQEVLRFLADFAAMIGTLTAERLQRKNAFDSLQAQAQLFSGITETASDAVVLVDHDGCIRLWNRAAEMVFGYTSAEASDRNVWQLLAPERHLSDYAEVFKTFRDGGLRRGGGATTELQAVHKDGQEISVRPSTWSIEVRGEGRGAAACR